MLARLPREPVDLIGFSLGAKIALSIAVHAPERIRRLVVAGIGDNLFAPESVGEAAAKALEHGIGDDTPASVRAFLSTWQPRVNNALAVAALLRRPSNPQIDEHQLSASNISTLLINGSDDAICMQTDILLPALRPIRHLVIARAGHFDLMARAETLDAAELFLESPQSPHSQETD
jgi:pimeloyl-ACP methyl ester carboxylesterase